MLRRLVEPNRNTMVELLLSLATAVLRMVSGTGPDCVWLMAVIVSFAPGVQCVSVANRWIWLYMSVQIRDA